MLEYIKTLLNEYDYPEDAKAQLLPVAQALLDEQFYSLISPYEKDFAIDVSETSYKVSLLAKEKGLNDYSAQLVFYLALTRPLKKHYEAQNLPLSSYYDVLKDLKYKAEECHLVQDVWGTFVSGWHVGFFNLARFSFGRLQFELLPFSKLFKRSKNDFLPADTPIINVHIPRNGQSLSPDLVNASYAQAKNFYKTRLNGKPTIFTCESWLLYSKNLEVLSEKSNIKKFILDYTIIEEHTDPDYSEVWRLFDCKFNGNPDELPTDSSLRRAYVDWIKKGQPIGHAVGVYFYDKNS